MLKYILIGMMATTLTFQSIASDLHLKLPEKAYSVLAPKENALTLEQVQTMVVNDQLDIQISYENLLQAQKKIAQARAQYFPYGLGTVAAIYLLNSWNPLILVELVTSLPSKVYNVLSEKNMRMATQYSNKALALNIQNQVANLYFTILKEETALKLSRMQLSLLESLYKVTEERVMIGLSQETELRSLEFRILDMRDILLRFEGYLSAEKAAFNTLISQNPEIGNKLELQPVSEFLNASDYGLSSEVLKRMAIDRSPEIVAADYMVTAAKRNKSSTKWSVLSFSGIGFDYWSRIQISGSEIEGARLKRRLVQNNLENQVYILNNDFHRSLDFFNSEKVVFADTALFYDAELARFMAEEIALDRLLEAGILYVKDFSEYAISHYDALIELSDLERGIVGSAKGNSYTQDLFEVEVTELNGEMFSLSIDSREDISTVVYAFDQPGWNQVTVKNSATGYRVVYKRSQFQVYTGHVNITLKNGKKITKLFSF